MRINYFFVVVVLVFMILIGGCTQTGNAGPEMRESPNPSQQLWKEYKNSNFGLTLKYPSNWNIIEDTLSIQLSKSFSKASWPEQGGFVLAWNSGFPTDLDWISVKCDQYRNQYEDPDPRDIHIIDYGYGQLGSIKTCNVTYYGTGNNSNRRFFEIDFTHNGKNLIIKYDAPDKVYLEDIGTIQQIIGSITLTTELQSTPPSEITPVQTPLEITSTEKTCTNCDGIGKACCNGICYSTFGDKICCGDKLHYKFYQTKFGSKLIYSCCGDQLIDLSQSCCNGQPLDFGTDCCNGQPCPTGQRCCNLKSGPECYNPNEQYCIRTIS